MTISPQFQPRRNHEFPSQFVETRSINLVVADDNGKEWKVKAEFTRPMVMTDGDLRYGSRNDTVIEVGICDDWRLPSVLYRALYKGVVTEPQFEQYVAPRGWAAAETENFAPLLERIYSTLMSDETSGDMASDAVRHTLQEIEMLHKMIGVQVAYLNLVTNKIEYLREKAKEQSGD